MASLIENSFAVASSAFWRVKTLIDEKRSGSSAVNIAPGNLPQSSTATQSAASKRIACTASLIGKTHASCDTISLRFSFNGEGGIIPVGKHIKVIAPNPALSSTKWNGKEDPDSGEDMIERKYTPIESTTAGFTLIVKVYMPSAQFPDGGKMSQYLNSLKVGDNINAELPFGLIQYFGDGLFRRSKNEIKVTDVAIIVGGSGATPMLRLVQESLKTGADAIKFSVLNANRSEKHIICRSILDNLTNMHPDRLRMMHILSNPTSDWTGHKGYITKELIMEGLPRPSSHVLVLVCGPPQMTDCVVHELQDLGYDSKQVWEF